MRSIRELRALLGLIGLGLLASCTQDPNQTKLQYMPDMADAPAVKPQLSYLDPPEGSIPRNAQFFGETPEETAKLLPLPMRFTQNEKQHLGNGKKMYGIYCVPCHGNNADGNGTVTDLFSAPPDLNHDNYRKQKYGYFYHRIVKGTTIMPGYGHSLGEDERWETAMYLTELINRKKSQ